MDKIFSFGDVRAISWGKAALFVLLFMILQGIAGVAMMSAFGNADIGLALSLIISYIGTLYITGNELNWPNLKERGIGFDLVSIVAAFVLFSAFKFATMLPFEFVPGYEDMINMYMDTFGDLGPMVMIIASLIGPVVEEIFFRGMIQGGLTHQYNAKRGIIISSLFFGLVHMIPVQVIAAFFMGLVLAWIYYKTRSLWIPILIHVINNSGSMIMMEMSGEDMTTMMRDDVGDMAVIGIIVGGAALSYVLYRFLDQRWSAMAEDEETGVV